MDSNTTTDLHVEQEPESASFKKTILLWQIFTGIALFAIAAVWHYLYEWTLWTPLAFIAPANSSVFEHLKLTPLPSVLLFSVQYPFLRKKSNNFFVAKAIGIFLTPLIVMFGYYFYTGAFTGANNSVLWIDLLTLIAGIFVQQLVGYKLHLREPLLRKGQMYLEISAIVLVVLLIVLMGILAFFPPQLPLFYSFSDGYYGLPPSS